MKGNKFDTRLVLPVSSVSSAVQAAPRGTAPRDTRRREATQRFLQDLLGIVLRAGSDGVTLALAGRYMREKQGFARTLREQRMTFKQFVDLNADNFRTVIRGTASKIFATPHAIAKTGRRLDGTLVQYQRLRHETQAA